MNYSTPETVRLRAELGAAEDYRCHKEFGVNLNPFSTPGAISTWQRGYDGVPIPALDDCVEYNDYYQRGAAARRLVEKKAKETS